jgi:hypothetical protein
VVKKSFWKKNCKLVSVLAILVFIALILLVTLTVYNEQKELEKIYATFSCNCCDSTLLASDAFCARGIKEVIKEYQDEGYHGADLYRKTVSLLGLSQVIDKDLRTKTFLEFNQSLPLLRPVINLNEDYINFGNVSESKEASVMKDFIISNTGEEDLYIYQVATSCSCLNAKFVTNEKESPIYGRFSFPYGMTVKIEPGKSQRLRVTYDAKINSFFRGHEVRFVYVHSNDVAQPTKQITVEVVHTD